MTAEGEVWPIRSARAAERAWEAVELPPDLRRGVEAAAKAAGEEPEAWLTRTVLAAAPAAVPRAADRPLPAKPDAEVARSLALLLSAARARSRERQAEAAPLTLEEPAPPEEELDWAPAIRGDLRAERSGDDLAKQPLTLTQTSPEPRRYGLALTLLVVTVCAAFGAGAFYLRYSGAPSDGQPALTAALPRPNEPAPAAKPDGATVVPATPSVPASAPAPSAAPAVPAAAPTPTPASAEGAPIPAVPPVPSPAPPPPAAAVPPPPPAATVPPPPPAPAAAAALPSSPPAPSPPPAAQNTATPTTQPPPPAATTAAALPPGVGPRVQPPPAPPEVIFQDYNLGVRYAFGTGVKQDYKKAAELFLKAAMQGLPDAQYNLGALYDNGLGVPKDPVRAVIWYHSAAEQNHPSAQLNLGLAYANGTGVAQDYSEAARWFRRAADQGVVTAQYNLAALYVNGRGVEQSYPDAYAWFDIAASSGDLEARDQMRRASETMSPQQLKTARALATKLAEGVKRPVAAGAPSSSTPQTADPQTASATPAASAPPAAAPPNGLAQPLDKGQLTEIQRDLARLQFDPGPSSGVLTDKTAEAIRKYQTDRKLKVDGEASRALLFRLRADVERLQ